MCESSLGARLRIARERANMRQTEAASRLEITSQKLSNWEADRHEPSRADLRQLILLYKVNPLWLLTGAGKPENEESTFGIGHRTARGRRVSRMEQAIAVLEKIPETIQRLGDVHTYFDCGPRSYVIDILDRSNTPQFDVGDAVVIDPDEVPRPGDMVLAAVKPDDHPVFRRYTVRTNPDATKYVELQPLNPAWESDIIRSREDGRIVGVMTEHAAPRR